MKALRRRPATEQEMKRGLGPMMGDVVEYGLDRRQVVAALQKAAREPDSPVSFDDVITADAGRPVREEALKYAFGDLALQKSLANPADAEPERGREFEAVELVYVEPAVPLVKCERGVLWVEGGRRELQRRLIAAIAKGDHRVSADDVAGLDDGGRIRKAALDAVLDPDEYLGDFGDLAGGEPLAKSDRPSKIEVALSFYQERGDADTEVGSDVVRDLKKSLVEHGYQVDTREAETLARLVAARAVECNTARTSCRVR